MKQKLEIEVEVPVGYVAIAYRQPLDGELFLLSAGTNVCCHGSAAGEVMAHGPRVILAKDEPLPVPTLKKGCWVAKDKDGDVYLFEEQPWIDDDVWDTERDVVWLNPDFFDVSTWKDVPWDKSLRQVR